MASAWRAGRTEASAAISNRLLPGIKREQIESRHEPGFFDRGESVFLLGSPEVG